MMPRIERRSAIETHLRQAELQDRAAASLASELSTERDPDLRERIATRVRRAREAAQFHRDTAAKLSDAGKGS
jgi:hypothetical protein